MIEKLENDYKEEMDYLNNNFSNEINDIKNSINDKLIFRGRVSGTVNFILNKKILEDYRTIHLNRALLGIISTNFDKNSSSLQFSFDTSSIYKLLCEIEYIRAYNKYKNLTTISLKIDFSNIISISNDEKYIKSEYYELIKTELDDIKRSFQIVRIFSREINAKYNILYFNQNEKIEGFGKYSSIYKLISELEKLRTYGKEEKNEFINIYITDLDDSKVFVQKNLFKRRDDESLITY